MPNNAKIKLAELPRRLRQEHGISVSYRAVYHKVLDGMIPAERDPTGTRWLVHERDLGAIAELVSKTPV